MYLLFTKRRYMKKTILLIPLFAMFFTSCTTDWYYAGAFLNKFEMQKASATEQIYVVLPKSVIHTNSSLNDIAGFMFMSEREQDSIIASKTAILNRLDDSIFLSQFNEAFLYVLSRTKMPVVVVDDESRLPVADDQHFTVNIVQVEAEEYMQPSQSRFATRGGTKYAYDYQLRHFSMNVWLRLDARDTADALFFKNREIEESFHGTVTSLQNGKATMKTHFDRIGVGDAYQTAYAFGAQCATLYVEKILSEYVCRAKGTNKTYFYYSPSCNCIEEIVPYDEGIKTSFEKM